MGGASVRKMVAIMLWMQALLWIAFLLLPFTGKLPFTGSLSQAPFHRLLWIAFLLLPFTGKLNPRSGKINYTRSRRKWADAWQFAEELELQRYKTKIRRAARRATRHDKVQYQRLKVEEHAELAVEKLGTGYVQQMDEKARGAHEKKLLELRRRCAERCDQTKHATTLTHASAHHGAGSPQVRRAIRSDNLGRVATGAARPLPQVL